jgi:hypothetical protein
MRIRTISGTNRLMRVGAFGLVCASIWTVTAPAPAARSITPVPCAPSRAAAGWVPGVAGARAWIHARRGDISFAVRAGTRTWGYRQHHAVPAANLLKAMSLVASLDPPGVRHRRLRPGDAVLLVPMIRRSDNLAATRVRDIVGDRRLVVLARAAGMSQFRPAPIWGLSQTTAADQSRFFLRIDHTVVARHRAFAMLQLRSIVRSQRWGIGRLRLPGWTIYFKGGWGTGTGRVDHQVALLKRGCIRVAVAVMTTDDGSHADGQQTLVGIFRRLLGGLPIAPGTEGRTGD